jgi:hypothetical protein
VKLLLSLLVYASNLDYSSELHDAFKEWRADLIFLPGGVEKIKAICWLSKVAMLLELAQNLICKQNPKPRKRSIE